MIRRTVFLMCLLALMVASFTAKAQVITITLEPGWTWISYSNVEMMNIDDALGSFSPMQDDIIKSQFGSSRYINGHWVGSVAHFIPGYGYLYYSARTEDVSLVFAKPSSYSVITDEPTDITASSAMVGGMVTVPEGGHVFLCGVCWGKEPKPDIDGDHLPVDLDTGSFSITLEDLDPNTIYYVRAYMVSDLGLIYGNELSFSTLSGDINVPTGAINGLFSVNEDTQIYFSQGNLQYIGNADTPYWKFADNQWDYLGTTTGQDSDNENVDRDLFSWGTSGYNHGAICYQPWSTSRNNSDYFAYGDPQYGLNSQTGQADWGYNPISNGGNQANKWRTLTIEEWTYVFETRETTSDIHYAKANVNNVNGVILLPDNWNIIYYSLDNADSGDASYSSNTITASQWSSLELHGAVFLPAAGSRQGTSLSFVGSYGSYWLASSGNSESVRGMRFYASYLGAYYYCPRFHGFSVRLVCVAR